MIKGPLLPDHLHRGARGAAQGAPCTLSLLTHALAQRWLLSLARTEVTAERLVEILHQQLIEILAPQLVIPGARAYFDHAFKYLHDRDIEGAPAQIKHQKLRIA